MLQYVYEMGTVCKEPGAGWAYSLWGRHAATGADTQVCPYCLPDAQVVVHLCVRLIASGRKR
jgi:hypothetical protein